MRDNAPIENETLLDMSERNYKVALNIWRSYPDDDGMLNIVGYHLQQTVELALKHVLETHAVKYPGTHDIGDLLDLIPSNYPSVFKGIEQYANKITALEAKTRYRKGFRTKLDLIQTIYEVTTVMLKEINDIEKRESILIDTEFNRYSQRNHQSVK